MTKSPTGIANVMMEPARLQSLPRSARKNPCTPASCESTHGSSQPGPGRPSRLLPEQPVDTGRRGLRFVFAEPADGERHGQDAEGHQRDHPQDRPAHLLISDDAENMMTETEIGRICQPRAVHADQPEHRAG